MNVPIAHCKLRHLYGSEAGICPCNSPLDCQYGSENMPEYRRGLSDSDLDIMMSKAFDVYRMIPGDANRFKANLFFQEYIHRYSHKRKIS